MPVVKIHGSVNWLYCDNCRQLYWFPADDAIRVAMQLITPEEAKKLKLKNTEGCAKMAMSELHHSAADYQNCHV